MPFCGLAPRRCKLAHPSASLHDRAAGLHVTPLACTSDVHVYEKTRWLFDQFESPKIVFGPVGCVEHAGKRLDDEGIRCVMVGDGDGAAVLVFVAAVASFSAGEIDPSASSALMNSRAEIPRGIKQSPVRRETQLQESQH